MGFIQIRGVSKRFGTKSVLDGVDLEIPEGSIYGIIGVNGSGKTTLLKILVGFYMPDSGSVYYNGKPLKESLDLMKNTFGFTTQENIFYPQLTVEENISYFGNLYGLSKHDLTQNLHNLLALLELTDVRHTTAQHLSGGMQRRLDMACSLVHNPKVLILDEPTEDLDPLLRKDILRFIHRINDLGTTVIITSHLLDDVEHLCNHVALLDQGKIVQAGTVDEFLDHSGLLKELHLETRSHSYDYILQSLHLENTFIQENVLVVSTPEPEKVLHNILHLLENAEDSLLSVMIRKPKLEDVFAVLTNRTWFQN